MSASATNTFDFGAPFRVLSSLRLTVVCLGLGMLLVFLGTLVFGDEMRALQYGQDQLRDVAGYVERIGPARWRILMPKPHFESQFDVMELVPANR